MVIIEPSIFDHIHHIAKVNDNISRDQKKCLFLFHNVYTYFPPSVSIVHDFPPGVNFINFLQSAFARADPKCTKKTYNLTVFFTLLGSERIKAAQH